MSNIVEVTISDLYLSTANTNPLLSERIAAETYNADRPVSLVDNFDLCKKAARTDFTFSWHPKTRNKKCLPLRYKSNKIYLAEVTLPKNIQLRSNNQGYRYGYGYSEQLKAIFDSLVQLKPHVQNTEEINVLIDEINTKYPRLHYIGIKASDLNKVKDGLDMKIPFTCTAKVANSLNKDKDPYVLTVLHNGMRDFNEVDRTFTVMYIDPADFISKPLSKSITDSFLEERKDQVAKTKIMDLAFPIINNILIKYNLSTLFESASEEQKIYVGTNRNNIKHAYMDIIERFVIPLVIADLEKAGIGYNPKIVNKCNKNARIENQFFLEKKGLYIKD